MARELKWRSLLTGVFFLVAVGILVVGLLIVGTNQNLFARTFLIHTYLSDTQSLASGTAVTLAGIEVGVIDEISLASHDGENQVRLDLRIREKYRERITTSSHGVVKSIGVLGDKFLEITQGQPGEPQLEEGAVIETTPAVDWEKVARDISTELTDVLRRVDVLLAGTEAGEGTLGALLADSTIADDVRGAFDRLDRTLAKVESGNGTLGRLVNDPSLYRRMDDLVARLDSTAARLNEGDGTLGRLLTDSTLYVSSASAATRLDSITAGMQAGRGTVGKALNDDRAYEELHRAIQDLRFLLIDLQEHPERYVRFSVF